MAVLSGEVTGRRVAARKVASRAAVLRPEDVHQLALQLAEMLAQARPGKSFAELAAAWLGRISPTRVCPENERRHVRHLAELGPLREKELTKARIEEVFGKLLKPAGHLSAASVNKLRSTGRLIIQDAQGNGEWGGVNPFELARRFRPPERVYLTLTLPEVLRVLPHLRADRRRMVKLGVLVGLRPGEALGLRKADVDLELGMLHIRRSHGRNQTKTGKERKFPIPDALVEDLRQAMEASATEYVFPGLDGSRQRADTKLARMLRQALRLARVVSGYRYRCCHRGCAHEEIHQEAGKALDCPSCGYRLRCYPVPKPLRYYDLRHTCSTLHREAGCDPLVIQEMLGHARKNLTDGTYTHLTDQYRRRELNKMKLV